MTPEEMKVIEEGSGVYQSLCFSCHANDGRGTPLAGGAPGAMMAPPLAGSPRVNGHRDYIIKVLLKGVTGPLGDAIVSRLASDTPRAPPRGTSRALACTPGRALSVP